MRAPANVSALLRLLSALAAEITLLAALIAVGRDHPGSPPISGWARGSLSQWWSARDPIDAVAGAGRVLAIGLCAYLILVTLLHLVSVLIPAQGLRHLTSVIGPRFLVGLAATAALSSAPVAGADEPEGSTSGGAGATMEVVSDDPSAQVLPRTVLPWAGQGAATPPPGPVEREVVVSPGDSFWSLAAEELEGRLQRTPATVEIDLYWRSLIEANRDRLVESDNPDLIHPGQVFRLP